MAQKKKRRDLDILAWRYNKMCRHCLYAISKVSSAAGLTTGASVSADLEIATRITERRTIWALLFGNFIIGTGILLPAGMLSELADAFSVSVPKAGTLMLGSGIVVAAGAPLVAAFTSSIDRRRILAVALAFYAAGHAVSAMCTSFNMLMLTRVIMVIGAAIFTPQAAATLGALIPPERRSNAITLAFVGWSAATVAGMPMGGYLANTLGWRAAFEIMAVLSALSVFAIVWTVPKNIRITALNASSWRQVASSPALLMVLAVTILNGSGQFTLFTYLNPSLKASLHADTWLVTAVLAWFGVWAMVGNVVASRFVAKAGASNAVSGSLLMMALALTIWGAGATALVTVMLAAALWGAGTFSSNSMQQARLADIDPALASASIALNTSAIYIGQGTGAALGGSMIKAGNLSHLPWTGGVIVLAAAALSVFAGRHAGRI